MTPFEHPHPRHFERTDNCIQDCAAGYTHGVDRFCNKCGSMGRRAPHYHHPHVDWTNSPISIPSMWRDDNEPPAPSSMTISAVPAPTMPDPPARPRRRSKRGQRRQKR